MKPNYPLFQMYKLEELSELLGKAESTLLYIKNGYKIATPRFRFDTAAILGQSEEELFGGE